MAKREQLPERRSESDPSKYRCYECDEEFAPKRHDQRFDQGKHRIAFYSKQRPTKTYPERVCAVCGEWFIPGRKDRRWHTSACRMRAQRAGQKMAYEGEQPGGGGSVR